MNRSPAAAIFAVVGFWALGLSIARADGPTAAVSAPPDGVFDYNYLCSYDDKWCPFLKEADGSLVKPTKVSIEILRYYRNDILAAAKLYHVDPRSIAGAIMADMVLTPMGDSGAREFLRAKATGRKARDPALGIIHADTAWNVEDLAAKTEGRPKRDQKDVPAAIDDPKGNINYVAAIIRDAIDTYKKYGLDIEGHPEFQTTLYNLGNVEKRAQDKVKTGGKPRYNFFGFFVGTNLDLLTTLMDPAEAGAANLDILKPTPASVCQAMTQQQIAVLQLAKSMQSSTAQERADLAALAGDVAQKLGASSAYRQAAFVARQPTSAGKETDAVMTAAYNAVGPTLKPHCPNGLSEWGIGCPESQVRIEYPSYDSRGILVSKGFAGFSLCNRKFVEPVPGFPISRELCATSRISNPMPKVDPVRVTIETRRRGYSTLEVTPKLSTADLLAEVLPYDCTTRPGGPAALLNGGGSTPADGAVTNSQDKTPAAQTKPAESGDKSGGKPAGAGN